MSDILARIKGCFGALVSRSAKMKRSTLAWTGLALAAVVLLSINLISSIGLKTWRADLTQDRLYTISDGTREILKDIDEPITAKLYFSRNLAAASPDIARYFGRVRALFQQYRDISGGKLQLTVLDPEPFTDAEDKAVAAGLKGLTLNAAGEVGYFGLVATNATDNQQVIPFFSPSRESFLEYDVTKLIYGLEHPKKRTIGLMTSLPLDGGKPTMGSNQQQDPWLILTQIREFFDVRPIDQTVKEIPPDIDALMIAQPTKLTPAAAFAIDQYALKGGKVLAFVDPSSETAYMQLLKQREGGEAVFAKLLHGWGVNFNRKEVAADIRHARRVQFGGGPGGEGTVTDFVAWLGLDKSSINPKDVLSAGIEQINLASAGFLSKVDDAPVKFSPILETSSDAEVVDVGKVGFGADPLALLRNYKSGGKKLVLAARLSGDIKSAFPDGPPKPPSDDDKAASSKDDKPADKTKSASESEKPADSTKTAQDAAKQEPASKAADDTKADDAKTESESKTAGSKTPGKADHPDYVKSGKIHAIIVADTDILADRFWVTAQNIGGQNVAMPIAHNGAFVLGALENLSGSNALIALRGRGVKERPFTLVEALRRNAERKFRSKEQALEEKLKSAQSELQKIQTSGGGKTILSDKEQEAVDKFRGEVLTTRRELRNVKHALREDIDTLGGWLKFANIAFVPLMLGAAAIGLSWRRTRQRRRKPKNER